MFVNLKYISMLLSLMASLYTCALAQSEAPAEFRDDFTGSVLKPEWRMSNQDPDRWMLSEGEHLLLVTSYSTGDVANELTYAHQLGPGDFEVVAKIQVVANDYQIVRIKLNDQKDNSLRFVYSPMMYRATNYYEWPSEDQSAGMIFAKTLSGKISTISAKTESFKEDAWLYFRLKKQGIEYHAAIGTDGQSWTEVGKHILLTFTPTVSFAAYNISAAAPESPVRIDFVQITPVE